MEIAVLALGCFWGPEIKFGKIDGVIKLKLVRVIVLQLLTKRFVQKN